MKWPCYVNMEEEKPIFFVPQKAVSVLTISMFGEYLYNRVRKRIYLENQSQ